MTYKSVICWASCYQIVKMSSFFPEGVVFIDGGAKDLVLKLRNPILFTCLFKSYEGDIH
jgi:hypothetical protein